MSIRIETFENILGKACQEVAPRRELSEYLPLLLVLCAWRKKTGIIKDPDGRPTGLSSDKDPLLNRLFDATMSTGGGQRFHALEKLIKALPDLDMKVFEKNYFKLLDSVLGTYPLILYHGTNALPPFYVSRTAASFLSGHGCKSVLDHRAGISSMALALDPGTTYYKDEPSGLCSLIGDVLLDAAGKPAAMPSPLGTGDLPDAVVSCLPVDYYFDQVDKYEHEYLPKGKKQGDFFYLALDGRLATKAAVGLIHFQVGNDYKYEALRKDICESGHLEMVITFPNDVFADAQVQTSMVFLDLQNKHDSVTFIAADKSIKQNSDCMSKVTQSDFDIVKVSPSNRTVRVPAGELKDYSYAFNSYVYLQDAICEPGQELVPLGEIATFVKGYGLDSEPGKMVSRDALSNDVELAMRQVKMQDPTRRENYYRVSGPAVFFRLAKDWTLSAGVNLTEDDCYPDIDIYTLQPKDGKVSPQYLAYLLLTDDSLKDYFSHIIEYYANIDGFRKSHILNRKVSIYKDPAMQRKIVERFVPVTPKNMVYNVLVASPDPEGFKSTYGTALSKNGFKLLAASDRVGGPDGLEGLVSRYVDDAKSPDKKADAVIFDTLVKYDPSDDKESMGEGFDEAIRIMDRHSQLRIPFYAVSDNLEESGLSARKLAYFLDGDRFGDHSTTGFEAMTSRLKDELDSIRSLDSILRNQHPAFFEAAAWADGKFGTSIAETVTAYIKNDYLLPADPVSKPFNALRILTEGLIKEMKKVALVPKELSEGAVPEYLYDDKYVNKANRTTYYALIKDMITKPQAASLVSLYKTVNEGSHKMLKGSNLGRMAIASFMEFAEWAYQNKELFDRMNSGYYSTNAPYESQNDGEDIEIEGVVKCDYSKGQPYYYCENVHLYVSRFSPEVKEGDKVVIRNPSAEREPREDLGVTLFATTGRYSKKK